MIRVLELFAGIGACSKALTNLGIEHEIVDAVEIDKYAIKSFNAIHGTNFEPQDITTWDKDIKCDLIMHGSPCQDFSVAGKGAGGDKDSGTRSSLMYETLRIVEKLKPKYVIWENVKNLLGKKHRHNFDAYIKAMYDLGYNSFYKVLNAKDYGVPQNRERVFTVSVAAGYPGDFKWPEPVELKKRLKGVLEDSVDEKYYLSDEQVSKIKFCKPSDGISKTIRAGGRGSVDRHSWDIVASDSLAKAVEPQSALVQPVDRGYKKHGEERKTQVEMKKDGVSHALRTNGETLVALPEVVEDFYKSRPARVYKGIAPTLRADRQGLKVAEPLSTRGRDVLGTLRASMYKQGSRNLMQNVENGRGYEGVAIPIRTANKQGYDLAQDGDGIDLAYPESKTRRGRVGHGVSKTLPTSDSQGALDGFRIRKLTPKECWRLMGFGDEDFAKAEKVNSNTQLYKQAGNSIVVDVLMAIFKELLA